MVLAISEHIPDAGDRAMKPSLTIPATLTLTVLATLALLPLPARSQTSAATGNQTSDTAPPPRAQTWRIIDIRCWQNGVPIVEEDGIDSANYFDGGISIRKLDGTSISVSGRGGSNGDGGVVCVTRRRAT